MERKRISFTQKQWDALNELTKDENIIIKEADKGSAIVILGKKDYKELI